MRRFIHPATHPAEVSENGLVYTFHLREGASFHFRSDLPHSYRNTGRTVAKVLWVNSPPTF